ncbi:hypothetical protein [Myxococcus sp. RHSTA-1-4]|uniref:hypothetical protein n=1 Tax=Myxococcus sp. RHSTA-1-4 TaxID=2874601 RepID=UPI001CBCD017|nr:hypothetical protein [Myxococcus sp. RHSTA-1-4]MBZ4422956.1 hypothetical protein [Myxococcus sp. RHSTA-1-4]
MEVRAAIWGLRTARLERLDPGTTARIQNAEALLRKHPETAMRLLTKQYSELSPEAAGERKEVIVAIAASNSPLAADWLATLIREPLPPLPPRPPASTQTEVMGSPREEELVVRYAAFRELTRLAQGGQRRAVVLLESLTAEADADRILPAAQHLMEVAPERLRILRDRSHGERRKVLSFVMGEGSAELAVDWEAFTRGN